ncbi:MAG: rffA [Conexibacter sp.]|nr:rffA [Conexibacter sp.]
MTENPHHIPFNKPYRTGREAAMMEEALHNAHLSSDGPFTAKCKAWLEDVTGTRSALLTHSATGALEAAAILAEVGPGDEVIMPSFTFVTTATAFLLRGATPVFVDIREDTLNVDEDAVAAAITPRTKAIAAVHYAGVGCDMDRLKTIADDAGAILVEDAAQAILSSHNGQPLGAIGHLGALSFHETKNVTCGEGGALLVNDPDMVARAEIIRDKGTNRKEFFRGQVDKYTWMDIGSSFGMSEVSAAFLWAQLTEAQSITERRLAIWNRYYEAFAPLEEAGFVRRPVIPDGLRHNAHLFYLLAPDLAARTAILRRLNELEVNAVFHYVPLHSSPAGERFGRAHGDLTRTTELSERLLRLPLWVGMSDEDLDRVVGAVEVAVTETLEDRAAGLPA